MQNTKLEVIVDSNKIKTISLFQGEGVNRYEFDVESADYMEQKGYGVDGPYRINLDMLYIDGTLVEPTEELTPVKVGEMVDNEVDNSEQEIEEAINTPVTVVVFNRVDLTSAIQSTTTQHIPAFVEAVKESYEKNFGEFHLGNFALIEIDFENKTVKLKSIAE